MIKDEILLANIIYKYEKHMGFTIFNANDLSTPRPHSLMYNDVATRETVPIILQPELHPPYRGISDGLNCRKKLYMVHLQISKQKCIFVAQNQRASCGALISFDPWVDCKMKSRIINLNF